MTQDSFWHYAWMGLAAWFGILARSARWTTPEGRVDWRKALLEMLAAPALGIITAAVGVWAKIDPIIIGGGAALLGLLGPAAISDAVIRWINAKIGSQQ